MTRSCPQCGTANEAAATFCAQCGIPLAPAPATVPAGAARTVLGMSAADLRPPPAAAAPPPAAAAPANRTVLGMPAASFAAAPSAPAAAPAASAGPGVPAGAQRTMLGVAVPGIAPLNPGSAAPSPPHASAAPASAAARLAVENENRTMLGVPAVGAAPPPVGPAGNTSGPLLTGAFIAPAPPPLELEAMPSAPKKVKRSGVPMGVVAGGLAALVLGIGGTAALLLRNQSPLVVQPRLSPKGTDVLHLACATCPDGTKVSQGAETAEFKDHETDLELAAPLRVGDNALTLKLDRPSMGRDEEVKALVPVHYRIHADLAAISAATPLVTIVVETEPGSSVKLDDKPLALDASGKGNLPIDLTADCTGMADESRTVTREVKYEVTLKDHVEKGSVTARVGVPALRIDAPLVRTVIGGDRFFVAGRTVKGAQIAVNGRPVTVDASGIFSEPFGAPTATELAIEVRATAPSSAPRVASLKLKRSDALEADARAAEKAQGTPRFADLIAAATSATPGAAKPASVEGELSGLRVVNHQSVFLVESKKTCERKEPPCLVRVIHGAELDLKPGTRVLVVGRATRMFTPPGGGATVPELEAEWVAPLGAGK